MGYDEITARRDLLSRVVLETRIELLRLQQQLAATLVGSREFDGDAYFLAEEVVQGRDADVPSSASWLVELIQVKHGELATLAKLRGEGQVELVKFALSSNDRALFKCTDADGDVAYVMASLLYVFEPKVVLYRSDESMRSHDKFDVVTIEGADEWWLKPEVRERILRRGRS
jgi:hypothetical protein